MTIKTNCDVLAAKLCINDWDDLEDFLWHTCEQRFDGVCGEDIEYQIMEIVTGFSEDRDEDGFRRAGRIYLNDARTIAYETMREDVEGHFVIYDGATAQTIDGDNMFPANVYLQELVLYACDLSEGSGGFNPLRGVIDVERR